MKVNSGSTHPRQATEWSAEIDQAKCMQDGDKVGLALGDNQMSFETLDERPREDHEPRVQEKKNDAADEIQEKTS